MKKQAFPYKRVHMVGIKGVAMAALAVYLAEAGVRVTGSDVPDDFPTAEELTRAGIVPVSGFDASHVRDAKPDMVVFTGAHGGRDNPEVREAVARGIPAYPHGTALGQIAGQYRQIVAAGCHGKTTTSAMVAVLLEKTGVTPSYAVGCGSITGIGAAGHFGTGEWFVAEGDEYVTDPNHDMTPRFLWLAPEILIVTNIDYDHPDAYKSLDDVTDAFRALQKKAKLTLYNADDPNCRALASDASMTYGFSPAATYQITHVGTGEERMFFALSERGVPVGEFSLKVPGKHNVMNAAAALVAAHQCGATWDALREALHSFAGTKRRFEKLGECHGVTYYDDYAHHPTEIAATLASARQWYKSRRIIAVFQPHTYSRTKSLLTEFAGCFADADTVVITEIYASAREHDTLGITGKTLVAETSARHRDVRFAADAAAVTAMLAGVARPGDVVLFMGAGDIYNWETGIMDSLKEVRI